MAVEFAITAGLAFLFFFGAFEFSRVAMIRGTIDNAIYEGARLGITPGATAPEVEKKVRDILGTSIGESCDCFHSAQSNSLRLEDDHGQSRPATGQKHLFSSSILQWQIDCPHHSNETRSKPLCELGLISRPWTRRTKLATIGLKCRAFQMIASTPDS